MEELEKHDSKIKEVLKKSEKCYVNIYPIDEVEEEVLKAKH
jgi:hypothetical protein